MNATNKSNKRLYGYDKATVTKRNYVTGTQCEGMSKGSVKQHNVKWRQLSIIATGASQPDKEGA